MTTGGAGLRARSKHLKTLTAMRWGAAAIVVLPHLYMTQLPGYVVTLFNHSAAGVMFFFMLSGFVLTWSMKPGGSKLNFYRRRFARIYPLHLATLLLAIPVIHLEGHSPAWAALPFTLTLTQAWLPFSGVFNAFNSLSWSLSCEMFFYALFPFVIPVLAKLTKRGRGQMLIVLTGLVAIKGIAVHILSGMDEVLVAGQSGHDIGHWAGYYLPLVRVIEFLAGILIALEVRDGARCRLGLAPACMIALGAFLAAAALPSLDLGTVDALLFLPSMLLLFAGATRDLSGAPAPRNWMVLLGQASFAMYMVQQLILRVVIAINPDFFRPEIAGALALAIAAVAVLTAISVPVHSWFEVPFERLLRPKLTVLPMDDPRVLRVGSSDARRTHSSSGL